MIYITLDAGHPEFGIKDCNNDSFLDVDSLGISFSLLQKIETWYNSYQDLKFISNKKQQELEAKKLDETAISLSKSIKEENKDVKIDYYFSDHFGTKKWLIVS